MAGEMRRKDRKMGNDEALEILKKCEYGILSTMGSDGYAYGVPLSYVYMDGSIYFHCATEGYKLENIKNNDRVSFCVVGYTEPIPERFSTKYESVIVFGRAAETYGDEKHRALLAIVNKYANEYLEKAEEFIREVDMNTKVLKIHMEHFSGKARR